MRDDNSSFFWVEGCDRRRWNNMDKRKTSFPWLRRVQSEQAWSNRREMVLQAMEMLGLTASGTM